MSEEKSVGAKILEQLTSPWDWIAAIAGAGGGAIVTVATGGLDFGTSIPAGMTTAVTGRRAAVASLEGRNLKGRAEALREELETQSYHPQVSKLIKSLDRELSLWKGGSIPKEDFREQLNKIVNEYRKIDL